MRHAFLILVVAAACGGGTKQPDTTPPPQDDDSQGQGSGGSVGGNSGGMVSPDKMDEAERDLNRKSMIMSQCLASAMESGDLKRGSHGKVALEIVVTGTRASSVKVIKSDFQVQAVNDCVVKHVQEIEFPRMDKPYETSHTYAMEAN
jgi:hypothetical protein